MARPARVRIRRRKPWVRLRRRLLGWNVRLLTGKLPNLQSGHNSGTVLTRHASQAGRAGGSGRYGSDLLTVRGTAKPVKLMQAGRCKPGQRDLGGLNGCWASMSSGHAEEHGEYRRLACTATLRLLASRFASQFPLSYRTRR